MAGVQKMNRPEDADDIPYSGTDPCTVGGNSCLSTGNDWAVIARSAEDVPLRIADMGADDFSTVQGVFREPGL